MLIIISGPSGVGKGTLCQKLQRNHLPDTVFSLSLTTRQRRLKETDGKEYHFVTQKRFQELVQANAFLEYVNYCGNWYGTSKAFVEENLRAGKNVILEIETQGAKKVMEQYPGMYTLAIFILPPNMEELERRIRLRHSETEDQVKERLETAKKEMLCKDQYDVCLTNYTVKKTALRLCQSIEKRKQYIKAVESGAPVPEGYIIKRP